ncbi:MAG TPA: glycoside hydrolase family 65 protein, partial [Rhodospirillales bacterium]|nr:glycoside hydrolase family 65 protein [Rhodospirillales bacterium]
MPTWRLTYKRFDPHDEGLREALCTLGNGYFCTRGAAEWASAGGVHYPGTYVAGGYNRLSSRVADRQIENEDLVNLPNWLPLSLRIENDRWFDLGKLDILAYVQELDLKEGLLKRTIRFRDRKGRETDLVSRRFVNMAQQHLAAIEWVVTARNWSGRLKVRSALDGTVVNDGVPRYRGLANRHLEPLKSGRADDDKIFVLVSTSQSRMEVAEAARTRVFRLSEPMKARRITRTAAGYARQDLEIHMEK